MENQYSNERLCELIQQGRTEYLFQLWMQCEKFVRMLADRYVSQFDRGQDLADDCVQEAYIDLHGIVLRYSADYGVKFLTFLAPSLHATFRSVMLSGHGSAEKDPLNNCDSLDRTVIYSDGDEQSLIDLIKDERSEDAVNEIDEADYRRSQNAFIRECIQLSREEIGNAILIEMLESNCGYREAICNLYGDQALDNEQFILKLRGNKDKAVRQIRDKTKHGIKKKLMRKYSLESHANRRGLRGYSLKSFREHSFTSEVESIVLMEYDRGHKKNPSTE